MTAVWVAHVFIVPGSHLSLFGTGDQKVADRFPSSILKLSEAREACKCTINQNKEVPHLRWLPLVSVFTLCFIRLLFNVVHSFKTVV